MTSTNVLYLQKFIDDTITSLEHVRNEGVKRELSYEINCSDLEDFNYVDIRQSEKFKSMFDELKIANGPTLYWFESFPILILINLLKHLRNIKWM